MGIVSRGSDMGGGFVFVDNAQTPEKDREIDAYREVVKVHKQALAEARKALHQIALHSDLARNTIDIIDRLVGVK